jgi:hypothetical protein
VWWLLALWTAGAEMVVRSDTACPSAAAVAAEIAPLLPAGAHVTVSSAAGGGAPVADRAEVVSEHGRRYVRLRDSEGRVVRERALRARLDCDAAARAAAVLLATWEFQGQADLPEEHGGPPVPSASPSLGASPPAPPPSAPSPPSPVLAPAATGASAAASPGPPSLTAPSGPTPASPSPVPAATPSPSTASAATTPSSAPASSSGSRASRAPVADAITASPAAARSAPPWSGPLAVGGGVSMSATEGSRPLGVLVEALWRGEAGAGVRAHLRASTGYAVPLADGTAAWSESLAGLGGTFTGRRGAWAAQAHADLVGARLAIVGQGFALNQRGSQLLAGVAAGARAVRAVGRARLWLDVTAMAWPGKHQVFLHGIDATRDLPGLELALTLGTNFFVRP